MFVVLSVHVPPTALRLSRVMIVPSHPFGALQSENMSDFEDIGRLFFRAQKYEKKPKLN